MKPTNKVMAGVIAGATVTILAWVSKAYGGVELPAEVQGAATVLITAIVQYVVPDAPIAAAPAPDDTTDSLVADTRPLEHQPLDRP